MDGRGIKDGRRLVYVGETKAPTQGMKNYYKSKGKRSRLLKISIPYDEYTKLKQTDKNPEFFNQTTFDRYNKAKLEAEIQDYIGQKQGYTLDPKTGHAIRKDPKTGKILSEVLHDHRPYIEKLKRNAEPKGIDRVMHKYYFRTYKGGKGSPTKIIEGDISAKNIKGSKYYVKNSLGQVVRYAKNNPTRFAKGVGKGAVGVGAIGGGTYLLTRKSNKNKS